MFQIVTKRTEAAEFFPPIEVVGENETEAVEAYSIFLRAYSLSCAKGRIWSNYGTGPDGSIFWNDNALSADAFKTVAQLREYLAMYEGVTLEVDDDEAVYRTLIEAQAAALRGATKAAARLAASTGFDFSVKPIESTEKSGEVVPGFYVACAGDGEYDSFEPRALKDGSGFVVVAAPAF